MTSIAIKIIVTGGGSGLSPIAPGTMGSIAATGLWVLLAQFVPLFSHTPGQIALVLFTCLVGTVACHLYLDGTNKDPQEVVIDEWAGVFIALLAASPDNIVEVLFALGSFRLFDIWKPGPVSYLETLPGAYGVMLDDILAGVFAALSLIMLRMVVLRFALVFFGS